MTIFTISCWCCSCIYWNWTRICIATHQCCSRNWIFWIYSNGMSYRDRFFVSNIGTFFVFLTIRDIDIFNFYCFDNSFVNVIVCLWWSLRGFRFWWFRFNNDSENISKLVMFGNAFDWALTEFRLTLLNLFYHFLSHKKHFLHFLQLTMMVQFLQCVQFSCVESEKDLFFNKMFIKTKKSYFIITNLPLRIVV